MTEKVLIIAPHMDDEVLGCAGAVVKHKLMGHNVSVVFVAHRVYGHRFDAERNDIEKSHALAARDVLGYDEAYFLDLPDERLDTAIQDIIIPLEEHLELRPRYVYMPFGGDNNQDHRAVYEACRVVFRPSSSGFLERLCMYEVPSSTEQSPPLAGNIFMPNMYVDLKDAVDIKLRALGCYETEGRPYPHPRSERAVKIHAQKRGIEAGFESAEAYMLLRLKWV
jgi:LmbE family N-acetylglucosaminyl deacetylase